MTDTTGTDLPKWASIQQTAEHLTLDEQTVRRYISAGRLTARRVGPRLIRVDRDSILKLLRPVGGQA